MRNSSQNPYANGPPERRGGGCRQRNRSPYANGSHATVQGDSKAAGANPLCERVARHHFEHQLRTDREGRAVLLQKPCDVGAREL